MPPVSVWMVRAALCHLVAGFGLGALLLADKGVSFAGASLWAWRATHVEMLLVGWTIQLVMGVGIWILPRYGLRVAPPRSRVVAAWLAFALINAGVVLVASGAAAAGRLVEIAAAASFVVHAWGRVSPAGLSQM